MKIQISIRAIFIEFENSFHNTGGAEVDLKKPRDDIDGDTKI